MDRESSLTDAFEQQLGRGRTAVSAARDAYDGLESSRSVPDMIVEAIGDLEQELDDLDQTLDITDEDVRLAERTAQQAVLLADVFAVFENLKELVVDAKIDRLRAYADGIETLRSGSDLPEQITADVDRLDRHLEMLEKLARNGRHGQVESNDRVSPSTIDVDLRDLDTALSDHVSTVDRAKAYLIICDTLLDSIHGTLSELNDENDDKTAFSSQLGDVKDRRSTAETVLDDDPETAARTGRIAVEGAFMLHQSTARAAATQQAAEELASIVEDVEDDVDIDIQQCASSGDVDALLRTVEELVSSRVERSLSERLAQLLREHDGSVERTAAATDIDVETIFDSLDNLYQDGSIADIRVVFER